MDNLNAIFDRYIRDVLPELAPLTQADYQRHIDVLRGVFGHRHPDEVKPRDVGAFLDVRKGKISRNRSVAVLSAIYSKAVGRWFLADKNPCLHVERNPSKPRDRYITDYEFKLIYAACPPRVRVMMEGAYILGQRQGDLLDLKWTDCHDDGIVFCQSKTGKKVKVAMSVAVDAWLHRCKDLSPDPCTHVISTSFGRPYTHTGFRALWQRYRKEMMRLGVLGEVDFPHFHDLRAKCISDDPSLLRASERAGHQNTNITKSVYDRNVRIVAPLL